MPYLELPDGDRIPSPGFGTWKMTGDEARVAVQDAVETGYRHIDCARIYENEPDIGRGLEFCLRRGDVIRDDLWVTSKLWNDAHAKADVLPALLGTLHDLQLEYVDLYLIHWPVVHRPGVNRPENGDDMLSLDQVPLAETWMAMRKCQESGLCRYIGVSNFSIPKLELLTRVTGITPAFNQVECHPYLQQSSMLDYCRQQDIQLMAYSPLGSGDRPVSMKRPSSPVLLEDPVIENIASQLKISPAQVVMAWALHRGTIPIPKSAQRSHMLQNLQATEIRLPSDAIQHITELDRGNRFVDGTFWEMPGSPYTVANLWDEP